MHLLRLYKGHEISYHTFDLSLFSFLEAFSLTLLMWTFYRGHFYHICVDGFSTLTFLLWAFFPSEHFTVDVFSICGHFFCGRFFRGRLYQIPPRHLVLHVGAIYIANQAAMFIVFSTSESWSLFNESPTVTSHNCQATLIVMQKENNSYYRSKC